jgi:hypothetical protein
MEKVQQPSTDNLLENPEIFSLYNHCLSTEFEDDIAYQQGLLTLVHACDLANMDENAGHSQQTIINVGLTLADIHQQTGHYEYCFGELDFLFTECLEPGDPTRAKINDILVRIIKTIQSELPEIIPCPVSAKILVS